MCDTYAWGESDWVICSAGAGLSGSPHRLLAVKMLGLASFEGAGGIPKGGGIEFSDQLNQGPGCAIRLG